MPRLAIAVILGALGALLLPGGGVAAPSTSPELVPFHGTRVITATWGAPSGGYHSDSAKAVDVSLPEGTPIFAAGSGTVVQATTDLRRCNPRRPGLTLAGGVDWCINNGFANSGSRIRIQHPDGRISVYLHLSQVQVTAGTSVAAGAQIGLSGNTGISTGPHLHYAETLGGVNQDPGAWVTCHGSARIEYTGLQAKVDETIRSDSFNCISAGSGQQDGDFVVASDNGEVYRIAGGAPIYVSSWTPFGGQQPTTTVTRAQLNAMRSVPRDGTFVRAHTGEVYRIAGGAPIYVSSWTPFGGARSFVDIDKAAIDRAGQAGRWSHLRARPADGTFIRAHTGEVYRVAGGAPIYVSGWAPFGGQQPFVTVDKVAIDRAGQAGRFRHLRAVPVNGTFIRAHNGDVYRIAGGAPIYVSSWTPFGGIKPLTNVDKVAIDRAGQAGRFRHLRAVPVNGTFIRAHNGDVYRIAGGAPIYVSSWTPFGGVKPFTTVDKVAIDRSAQSGRFRHLRFYPTNGTLLRGAKTKRLFSVRSGRLSKRSGSAAAAVDVDDLAINRAGQPGRWAHLLPPLGSAPGPGGSAAARGVIRRGNSGSNTLGGGSRADRLFGRAGNDRLFGRNGNDRLYGGVGNDRLFGGLGRDRLYGQKGRDLLYGQAGEDILVGGAGNDRLFGGASNDRLVGGTGRDYLSGGPGRDVLIGGKGRNVYLGGAGNDVINSRNRVREVVRCGRGRDRVIADRSDRLLGCERVTRR